MPTINHSTGTVHGRVYDKTRRQFGRVKSEVIYGFHGRSRLVRSTVELDDGRTVMLWPDEIASADNVAVLHLSRPMLAGLAAVEAMCPCDVEPDGPEAA